MTNLDWDRANVEARMKRQETEAAFEPSPPRSAGKTSKPGMNSRKNDSQTRKKERSNKSWDAEKERRIEVKKHSALLNTIRYLTDKTKQHEKDTRIFKQQIATTETKLKKEKYSTK